MQRKMQQEMKKQRKKQMKKQPPMQKLDLRKVGGTGTYLLKKTMDEEMSKKFDTLLQSADDLKNMTLDKWLRGWRGRGGGGEGCKLNCSCAVGSLFTCASLAPLALVPAWPL
jgi:hypothetical protein